MGFQRRLPRSVHPTRWPRRVTGKKEVRASHPIALGRSVSSCFPDSLAACAAVGVAFLSLLAINESSAVYSDLTRSVLLPVMQLVPSHSAGPRVMLHLFLSGAHFLLHITPRCPHPQHSWSCRDRKGRWGGQAGVTVGEGHVPFPKPGLWSLSLLRPSA